VGCGFLDASHWEEGGLDVDTLRKEEDEEDELEQDINKRVACGCVRTGVSPNSNWRGGCAG